MRESLDQLLLGPYGAVDNQPELCLCHRAIMQPRPECQSHCLHGRWGRAPESACVLNSRNSTNSLGRKAGVIWLHSSYMAPFPECPRREFASVGDYVSVRESALPICIPRLAIGNHGLATNRQSNIVED